MLCNLRQHRYLRNMNYDKDALAAAVITKRQIESRVSMREAGATIGVSKKTVHKAETRKPIEMKTLIKICAWLEKEPGEFFKPAENGI